MFSVCARSAAPFRAAFHVLSCSFSYCLLLFLSGKSVWLLIDIFIIIFRMNLFVYLSLCFSSFRWPERKTPVISFYMKENSCET